MVNIGRRMSEIMYKLLKYCISTLMFVCAAGCPDSRHFSFDIYNRSGGNLKTCSISFSGQGGNWPGGGIIAGGEPVVLGAPGPVPDSADLTWTDASGVNYSQHIQITPLPTPLAVDGSGDPEIYFVIMANGRAVVCYHDPDYKK